MANLIPTNVTIPAHLASRVGASSLAKALAGGIGGGPDFPRISIKGSRFRVVEGGTETVLEQTSLDVIIVGANPRLSKTYYAAQWTPDADVSAPDCYSLNGVSPASDATSPQADLCATCPQNVWGSKVTPQGQQIKACADQKRLAVVAADDPAGPIYLLQVTPAALKGLNTYQKELTMRGISPEIVRTRVGFDTDASFPKLKFGFGGFISPEALEATTPLFGSAQVLDITGEDGADQTAPASPKATAVRPSAPAVPVAFPAPQPAPAPAAAPARGFGAKKATPAAAPAAPAPAAAPAAPARGFGAKKATPAPAPVAPAAPAAPVAAASAAAGGGSLVDEISALLSEVADDA